MSDADDRANTIRACNESLPQKGVRNRYFKKKRSSSELMLPSEVSFPLDKWLSWDFCSYYPSVGGLFSKSSKVTFYFLFLQKVKEILRLLWENEAQLCSFISNIQGQRFGKKAGHAMFFLETILVPPIKFRPRTKAGDKVKLMFG